MNVAGALLAQGLTLAFLGFIFTAWGDVDRNYVMRNVGVGMMAVGILSGIAAAWVEALT